MRRTLLASFCLLTVGTIGACGVDTTQEAATASPTPSGTGTPNPTPTSTPTSTPTPTPTATPGGTVMEQEDNGTLGSANDLGASGAKSYSGACADDIDDDVFTFTAAAGAFTSTVTWNEANGDDIDIWVLDDLGVLAANEDVPPNDSPASITFQLPSAGTYYVAIICYGPGTNIPWTATANVP